MASRWNRSSIEVSSREEIAAQWEVGRIFEPQMNADAAAELLARWRSAVHRSLRWADDG